MGCPVAIANLFVQTIVQGVPLMTPKNWLLPIYFIMLFLADQFVIPNRYEHCTPLVYILEAPVMILSILLGSFWDPAHQAITFLMFMSVVPIFILDYPIRVGAVGIFWNVLFFLAVFITKESSIIHADWAHAIEFYLLSLAVSDIVLRLRVEVVYNLDRTKYHLEHDVLTDTRNRISLEFHNGDYVDKPLCVCTGIIDHLSLINDYYGRQCGDDVIHSFGQVLKEIFGRDMTYRFSGDEFLCFIYDDDPDAGLRQIKKAQMYLADCHFEGIAIKASASFGYVYGQAADEQVLSHMIQLSNIYAHQAHKMEDNTLVGGVFDEKTLTEAILESNAGTHAQPFEVNQLTGLPAMSYFVAHVQENLENVVDFDTRPHIGYVSIASFHNFNEKYGYEKGDELIKLLASLLKHNIRYHQLTYVSGAKFALCCAEAEIESLMDIVNKGLYEYMPSEQIKLCGGFVECHKGESVISLVDKARQAEKAVKESGSGGHRFYDEQFDAELRLTRYLINNVDDAIDKGWLKVYYQPIMWSTGKRVASLEALSRWDDPVLGMLAPYQFIGVLEREQLIYKLSLHVVRRALEDIKYLKEQGLPLIPVSVNLSRTDFQACDMVEEISKLVADAGLDPTVLAIEITESAFAECEEVLGREVERFHERGFAVWMDDFGSEYSTLNLLEELDFDLVKLDMRFMRNFREGSRSAIIVSDVLDMCLRLGMDTLVEGVEYKEQQLMLADMGANKLQGFLYSRPVPLDELSTLIVDRSWV